MGNLEVVEEHKQGGVNKVEIARILLDSEEVIGVGRYILPKEGEDGEFHYHSTWWKTDVDPSIGLSLMRKVYQTMQEKYTMDSNGQSDQEQVEKGMLMIPNREYGLDTFLSVERFSQLLSPDVSAIRLETPNGDFVFDLRPHHKEERCAGVVSHLNISDLITDFALGTAVGLKNGCRDELLAIYNRLLSRYPSPELK